MIAEFADRTAELSELHATLFPPEAPAPEPRERPQLHLEDEDVLKRMFLASNGATTRRLYDGDTTMHSKDDSAADLALCCHLAFWCGGDESQMDRLFRGSGLYRPKWERADYRNRTLKAAIERTPESFGSRPRTVLRAVPPSGTTESAPAAASVVARLPNLPPEFYDSRESLRRIRQAAHSRFRSADAVLHVVLARVAAMVEPARIDTGVGSAASLNYCSAVVGTAGSGKSDAWAIACDLYAAPANSEDWFADNLPLGSGEGIAEAYMGSVEQPASYGDKKPKQLRQQVRRNAFLFSDEGEALTRMLERNGATLGETLRRAWKGVPLGQRNGTAERTRHVVDYALGLVIGFQPSTIQPLLMDVNAGTPQRFLYASATDPAIPNEPVLWPEPSRWFSQFQESESWTLDPDVRDEIRAFDMGVQRGEVVFDTAYNAHGILARVKVAGLLAALEMRKHITQEDWQQALTVWQTSCAVRDALLSEIEADAAAKEAASNRRTIRRELAVEDAKCDKALTRAVDVVARHVQRGACANGCKRSCLTRAVASRDRAVVSLDAVIEQALKQAYIKQEGDSYVPA